LLEVPVPKLEEQQFIVKHIEAEHARIDEKKEKAEKLIKLLIEYRKALISEVVTGKIKIID
jgi:type I restriction enzyme S subunit